MGGDPGAAAPVIATTVIAELVAATTEPLFGKNRTSYWPGVAGIVTVHVFDVVPGSEETATVWTELVTVEPTGASAIVSDTFPGGFDSVAVREASGLVLVALTGKAGWARASEAALEVPPPGDGVFTLMARFDALVARSLAGMAAVSWVELT
jgi:hypothetical protein